MNNIEMKVEGNILTVQVDLSQDLGPSKSGKTRIIATSNGNGKIPGHDDIKFGMNVFRSTK